MKKLPARPRLYSVQKAAARLNVSITTLRRWDEKGILSPIRTNGGQRRYTLLQLKSFSRKNVSPRVIQNRTDVILNLIQDPPKEIPDPVRNDKGGRLLGAAVALVFSLVELGQLIGDTTLLAIYLFQEGVVAGVDTILKQLITTQDSLSWHIKRVTLRYLAFTTLLDRLGIFLAVLITGILDIVITIGALLILLMRFGCLVSKVALIKFHYAALSNYHSKNMNANSTEKYYQFNPNPNTRS